MPVAAGAPVTLSGGDLRWRMAVPADGRLPFDQVFPALMQWEGSAHPRQQLRNTGCRLHRLTLRHPDIETLRQLLSPQLPDGVVRFETGPPEIEAVIGTPSGRGAVRC